MAIDTPTPTLRPQADLLTREAVAARLALSVPTIDRLIARRELRAVRIGRSVRVRTSDLILFCSRLPAVR